MKKVLLLIILSGLVFFLSINIVSATSPANFTTDEIASASVTVKNQIETTKTLPSNVNIGNYTVNTTQYLHLTVKATNQININNETPITLQSDVAPSYQEEQLNTGSMAKTDYLDFARRIDEHMDDNHQAPPYGLIGLGKISYSSQVYLYSRILTIYKNYGSLPPNINLKAWSAGNIPITETQSFSFTPSQIVSTADGLKNTIESTKSLSSTVTITGVNINTAQFLHLAVQATNQINNNNTSRITLQNDNIPGSQEEQLNSGTMTKEEYLDFAQRINSHMNSNHQAPPYGLIGLGKISYSSQVYLYSRILSVYKTYDSLPLAINVKSWSATNIPIGYTTFTVTQVIDTTINLKTDVETNKILPTSVVVGGKTINTGQFLHLAVQTTNQLKNNNNSTILLEDDTVPSSSEESLSSGSLSIADYVDFAQRIDTHMDNNHQAPPYGITGLGKISYQNMVYIFSKILTSYHTNKVLPSAVNVKPWVEVINPVKNSRTAKRFRTIQAAINDATTLNGDSLILGDSVYKENVLVNKKLAIKPDPGVNIVINALNSLNPVFTVNYLGNGTTIQSLTITGATNSSGIYLTGTSNCNLTGNTIMGNSHGIYLYNSKKNLLSGNIVKNNTYSGIIFADSNYNTIKSNDASNNPRGIGLTNSHYNTLNNNTLKGIPNYAIGLERSNNNCIQNNDLMGNQYGIYIGITGSVIGSSDNNRIQNNTLIINQRGIYAHNSNGNSIIGNTLIGNQYGIQVYNSSANVNFNWIIENSLYGLYSTGNRTVNANNNWWGTNNPTVSSSTGSDIYIASGTVNYNPWIVLNVTAPTVVSNGDSTITVDLTHNNQGGDTSSQGHIPNGIIVNLTTNLGTVTGSVSTNNGKATAKFNRGTSTSGAATVKTVLNKQTIQTNISIDTTAPTVTANPAGGIYNTTKSVTLTATDILDSNPIIYYTTNGSNPTTSSTKYTTPLSIVSTTTLKFMAVDKAGNQAPIQTQNYIFSIVTNTNTDKTYSTIQDAINDPLTLNNHTIMVKSGTYSGNFVINKKLTIKPVTGCNVILQALNPSEPVIKINLSGNGTTIHGFTIQGATNSSGVYVTGSLNCNLVGNNFTSNKIGVFISTSNNTILSENTFINNTYAGILLENSVKNLIYNNTALNNQFSIRFSNSNQNLIQGNTLRNNATGYGIGFEKSSNNTILDNVITGNCNGIYIGIVGSLVGNSNDNFIQNNTLTSNQNGITLYNSTGNTLYQNTLTSNQYGVYCYYSSSNISFNRIAGNSRYGIYKVGTGMVNATNNWWGTNSPLVSSDYGSALYAPGGSVNSSSWIVMNLTGSITYVTKNSTSKSEISADLTRNNQGKDTSSSGTIPDGIPVNFTTTVGTITPSTTTRRGKATVTLTSSPSSAATTVSATVENQTISKAFRKSFSTIQSAINDPLTINGDVIVVANGTYTENILVNKNLTIISEGNVTVNAANPSQPVFTVNNVSGTVIYGFKIIGATHSSAIYLNRVNNCHIIDNTITSNGLDSTGDFGYGVLLNSTTNCTIIGNILQNNLGGIDLEYSNNTLLSDNNITNNILRGIYLYQNNRTTISENNLTNNDCGILACYSNSMIIIGNNVKNNTHQGIYLYYSSGDVHFNRIVGNGEYDLLSQGGSVNATNNWWGTNNPVVSPIKPSNIYVISGTVLHNPRLVLSITPTSYKVSDGKVYESTITTDLNHNSANEDLSTLVYAPDGIPLTFTTDKGNISSTSYTKDGKASSTLVLDPNLQTGLTNVTATLDGQNAFTTIDRIAKAKITIASSAIDISTNQTLFLNYEIPLNESVTWVSVLWKATSPELGIFQSEVNLIVNGKIVLNKTVVNMNYLEYKDYYSEKVFENINFLNWLYSNTTTAVLSLNSMIASNTHLHNLTGDDLETAILTLVKQENNFTDIEIGLIEHRQYFKDLLITKIEYPGDAAKKISFKDPDIGEITDLNFLGNPIIRVNNIIYSNGYYTYETETNSTTNTTTYTAEYASYEGLRSFAIATTRISDAIMNYWADQKDRKDINGNYLYPEGAMKASYGTFLNSLLVIKCHDIVADAAAANYNVTWSRTTPIVISTCDDTHQTLITGEMDHRMGMTVTGLAENVKAFRFACSSSFSPTEYWVMTALFPTNGTGPTYGSNPTGSVTMGLGQILLDGGNLEMFESNGYIIIRQLGNNTKVLVIDPETGILMDLMNGENVCGSYCYKSQQTEWAYALTESIWKNGQNLLNILINGNRMIDFSELTNNIKNGLLGFLNSAMMSLQKANMFLMNNIPSNTFSTFAGLNMVGLTANMVDKADSETVTSNMHAYKVNVTRPTPANITELYGPRARVNEGRVYIVPGNYPNGRYIISHAVAVIGVPLSFYSGAGFIAGKAGQAISIALWGADMAGVNLIDWEGMNQPAYWDDINQTYGFWDGYYL
jgi:parallel beta-helix repeat protein